MAEWHCIVKIKVESVYIERISREQGIVGMATGCLTPFGFFFYLFFAIEPVWVIHRVSSLRELYAVALATNVRVFRGRDTSTEKEADA